ncbi:SSI family serine proteinase inhibitor [Nonomuraea sp. NPDC023979]|uniref:SSI family serine proteinase inhibitor n=1 Tax=Nonomuraea sp. NPDC023979 TaxID=3154796 RepID=UPI0033EC48D8
MRLPLRIASAVLGVSLILSAAPAAAAARPNVVVLAVSADSGDTLRMITLQCPGRTDHHPYGRAACATIDAVNGDLDRLPVSSRRCTKERDPVEVTMNGMWRNRGIGWQKTFSNACLMYAATGPIFRF